MENSRNTKKKEIDFEIVSKINMSTEIKNYFAFHPLNGCVYHQKNRVLIINAKIKCLKT